MFVRAMATATPTCAKSRERGFSRPWRRTTPWARGRVAGIAWNARNRSLTGHTWSLPARHPSARITASESKEERDHADVAHPSLREHRCLSQIACGEVKRTTRKIRIARVRARHTPARRQTGTPNPAERLQPLTPVPGSSLTLARNGPRQIWSLSPRRRTSAIAGNFPIRPSRSSPDWYRANRCALPRFPGSS